MLDLLRPIYQKTAAYGHFGRDEPEFTWEATDKAEALRAAAGLSRFSPKPAGNGGSVKTASALLWPSRWPLV